MPSENTAQPGESCQFAMLEELCQQQTPVSIYLVNGIRLNGLIVDMDRFSILLRDATDQLIASYLHGDDLISMERLYPDVPGTFAYHFYVSGR